MKKTRALTKQTGKLEEVSGFGLPQSEAESIRIRDQTWHS